MHGPHGAVLGEQELPCDCCVHWSAEVMCAPTGMQLSVDMVGVKQMFTAPARHKPGWQLQGHEQSLLVQAAKSVSASMVAMKRWRRRVRQAYAKAHNPWMKHRLGRCSLKQLYWWMDCGRHLTYKTPQAVHRRRKALVCSRCGGRTDETKVTGKPAAA